jgi:hypothetical protein
MVQVVGMVVDGVNGSPIENATVVMGTYWTLTDERGFYNIENSVAPGYYKMKVLQRNYTRFEQTVNITMDCSLKVSMFPG